MNVRHALMIAATVAVSACTGSAHTPNASAASGECPRVKAQTANEDYLDFVHAFGRNYLADQVEPTPPIALADLGPVVLRVRCSFSQLNHETNHRPPEPRDGDAGFLPAGTPVFAVRGWPTDCRLAASADGRLRVYLAYQQHSATPERCAVTSPRPTG